MFYNREKLDPVDMTVADFDGVTYHISTPESKSVLQVSLGWACTEELFSHGAKEVLKREYGDLLLDTPEQGYDVTLSIDLDNVSKEPGK
jgi:actin related protein 2/3 complex subunit 2